MYFPGQKTWKLNFHEHFVNIHENQHELSLNDFGFCDSLLNHLSPVSGRL